MNEQPEALVLADAIEKGNYFHEDVMYAATELRRLHQTEREGWRYADELEKERKRLERVNQELMKVIAKALDLPFDDDVAWFEWRDQAEAALAKARGTE